MDLTAWFWLTWSLYSLVVVAVIVVGPYMKNLVAGPDELASDDEVDVLFFNPRGTGAP